MQKAGKTAPLKEKLTAPMKEKLTALRKEKLLALLKELPKVPTMDLPKVMSMAMKMEPLNKEKSGSDVGPQAYLLTVDFQCDTNLRVGD